MEINRIDMPDAPKPDFTVAGITNKVLYCILENSEVGTDYRENAVEVAKEILKRYDNTNEWRYNISLL